MKIIEFTAAHIEQAAQIAKQNYEEERGFVPALPPVETLPDLKGFADNNMGVAAFDGDCMVGYLCTYTPFDNAFGTTNVKGIWSPVHAHAAVGDRCNIYRRLYQAAAKKWVVAGALSHSITFYAHDNTAINAFFNCGFGLRCVDAIKTISSTENTSSPNYEFSELPRKEAGRITALRNALIEHLRQSPCFMFHPTMSEGEAINRVNQRDSRIFILKDKNNIIAFLEVMARGENFVCDWSDMMNICGAYLLPEYRGRGLFNALLGYAERILTQEGCRRLGVDFESFNPTAQGFWLKQFTAYTHSLVRRIDGSAIK